MSTTIPQKFEFQTEIKQLLDIVIHSLYTEKEIFVRELVSNASDALEKLRNLQFTEKNIYDDNLALEINITSDEKSNIITIQDFGIGMTRDELVKNLGTIAHSGSKQFLKALGEGGQKSNNLIGQFGVGFYSAFMVTKSVKVYSHSWKKDEPGHVWSSEGSCSYEIEEVDGQRRGAKVIMELKDDCGEFAKDWRLKEILTRYSVFVGFPITLNGTKLTSVSALWLRKKNEIKEEEYTEFYKFQSHSAGAPRYRLHFSADAPLSINALLFVPQDNTEKLGFARLEPSVALYCHKVLIDAKPKDLLPEWLRFAKGVVDSEDTPLNISRETIQNKELVEKLNKVITKRFIKMLEEEASQRADAYNEFYKEFGIFLKEGAALDFTHKDQLVKLLRFESSLTEKGKTTSLADYVSNMKDEQKEIYYLVAPSRAAIESGPYLEGFQAHNFEVLFCYEPVDDYVFNHVHEFGGKKFLSADHADVKLDNALQQGDAISQSDIKVLAQWFKDTLGEQVAEVKPSDRLVGSPVLATNADKLTSPQMRRMMRAMKKDDTLETVKVNLEFNPRHAVVKKINALRQTDQSKAELVTEQLFDNSLIAAGLLENPTRMIGRLNKLLESV